MMALELCVSEERLLLERRHEERSTSTTKIDTKDLSPELSGKIPIQYFRIRAF